MEEIFIFERKIYQKLLEWKQTREGRSALLIEGARRVGKSTIVEEFARKEYQSYILINFANTTDEIFHLFDDTSDLNYLFLRLQVLTHIQLIERQSIIIFDEVQMQPKARQAIKFLVADHRYDYIETGSLISIRKNVENIIIPSEETRLKMYPMDYEEFCWALGDKVTFPLLKQLYESKQPMGAAHRKMMRDFRLYMLIGGMPQAVAEYLKTNNMSQVDKVKRDILDLYHEDFYSMDKSGNLADMFDNIPAQLTSNASRYLISRAIDSGRLDRNTELISNLKESMTVNIAYQASDPNVGLALTKDVTHYKMYLADTGLFVTQAFRDKDFTENVIYQKLLSDKLSVNLGYVFENVVAQMLVSAGYKLFYHTFPTEDGKHNYEVDFLLSEGHKLCPIEVKSSAYKTHASLDAFCRKYSSRIEDKVLVYGKDVAMHEGVRCIPPYLVPFL